MINSDISYVEVKIDAISRYILLVFLIDIVIELRSKRSAERPIRLYGGCLYFFGCVSPDLRSIFIDP